MGWLYMVMSGAAAGLFYGTGPRIAFFICLVVLGISFASFCLMYDEPLKRAGHRITERMGHISGHGIHADEYQRLKSMKVTATEDDKRFRLTLMSGVNVASGIAGAVMLGWGLMVRLW